MEDEAGVILSSHLSHIDYLDGRIAPLYGELDRLMTFSGVVRRTAEVGDRRDRRGHELSPDRRASCLVGGAVLRPARLSRQVKERIGPHGQHARRVALCEAAEPGVRKNDSYLGAQFRRLQRRFGRRAEGEDIDRGSEVAPILEGCTVSDDFKEGFGGHRCDVAWGRLRRLNRMASFHRPSARTRRSKKTPCWGCNGVPETGLW